MICNFKKNITLSTFFLFLGFGGLQAQNSPELTLLAHSDLRAPAQYADCWGYIGPDNREYALVSSEAGIEVIDITDTDNLVEAAFFPGPAAIPGDIKVYQNYAYGVNDNGGGGMRIIDLSGLPDSATIAGNFTGFQTSHNIFIDTDAGVLFAEGDAQGTGVRIFSLNDPTSPQFLSSVTNGSHDIFVRDNILFVSEGGNSRFSAYDVTNPAAPQFINRFTTPSGGFAHNAWTNADNTLLLTTEETANATIKMWDISDLDNVTLLDEVLGSEGLAHNAVIKGDYGYISHYSDGLLIFDISNPDSLVEVGHYDTYPGPGPGGELEGAWGVYPFLKSGKVLVSDTETGLYVIYFEGAKEDDPLAINPNVSENFTLKQNYPNPFNPQTTIEFELPAASAVTLEIYDILGRRIATPYRASLTPGNHKFVWNATDAAGNPLPSGTYFYRLTADNQIATQKMLLIR